MNYLLFIYHFINRPVTSQSQNAGKNPAAILLSSNQQNLPGINYNG